MRSKVRLLKKGLYRLRDIYEQLNFIFYESIITSLCSSKVDAPFPFCEIIDDSLHVISTMISFHV